jgi:hypothetical protein
MACRGGAGRNLLSQATAKREQTLLDALDQKSAIGDTEYSNPVREPSEHALRGFAESPRIARDHVESEAASQRVVRELLPAQGPRRLCGREVVADEQESTARRNSG